MKYIIAALFVALGLASAGYFIGDGISGRNSNHRSIAVKGLSEREVPASLAIWTLSYSASGNDLNAVNQALGQSTTAVTSFLKQQGFDPKEFAVQPPSVHDHNMDTREKDEQAPRERFSGVQSVLLRTNRVDSIKPARAASSALVGGGVTLSAADEPNYIFDKLNDIKPGMIQEATKNAHIAAEQFAKDSMITLGKLQNASQGWFQVENRDAATPERKLVRVVVEVTYEVN